MENFNSCDKADEWVWNHCNSGIFSVQSLRSVIAKKRWSENMLKFRWCYVVPLKINFFAWRFIQNRIPLAKNLVSRGVNLGSICCPFCQNSEEEINHVFFDCWFARNMWSWLCNWSDVLHSPPTDLQHLRSLLQVGGLSKNFSRLRFALLYATIWMIWNARNRLVFKKLVPSVHLTADAIISSSFNWFKFRCDVRSLNWNDWCYNPYNCLM